MELIREYQLNIMLFMSGICSILSLMALVLDSLPEKRKNTLALTEMSAMLLLLADIAAYQYRGNTSTLGYYVVRISNGIVFFLNLLLPYLVTQYVKDVCENEGKITPVPKPLKICDLLFAAGTIMILISQFTGLYYTFDATNTYQRSPGYPLSYVVPFLMVVLQEITLIKYQKQLNRRFATSLMFCIALPTLFSLVQLFYYGVSLTNISMVIMVTVFYIYALQDLNQSVDLARRKEIETYKKAQEREAALFEETAQALARAIDAKDRYTHGHSSRVATISRLIAEEAGFLDTYCHLVYFSALLHDVGKIGIRDEVINKTGRLTDEEYEHIKLHPILGYQILSKIKQSPALSIGAHYHHERYDGRGYPEGLAGQDIPEIARIIAVADAYDAMSSSRSYRNQLSPEKTRQELVKGRGTQFDPKYADILLHIIDNNKLPSFEDTENEESNFL